MGVAWFPVPQDIAEAIRVLNASGKWSLTFAERGRRVYLSEKGKLLFTAGNRDEAAAFLGGCFAATFRGDGLDTITEGV